MPVTLAHERSDQVRTLSKPLSRLIPAVRPGWSLGFAGVGGWSLALMVMADLIAATGKNSSENPSKGAATSGRWLACVGLEELGLVAAHELGVPMGRLLMVQSPPADRWAAVTAALVEAVDVVCLYPAGPVRARDARRLQARAREQETVLIHLDGGRSWPVAMDIALDVHQQWSGLGHGHGHLRERRLFVEASGRRSSGRRRQMELVIDQQLTLSEHVDHSAVESPAVTKI